MTASAAASSPVAPTDPGVAQMIDQSEDDNYFRASTLPQPPELQDFLKERLANPFNKYCIDCKKNQTTHCLVWLGVFVCADCAAIHRQGFGGQSQNYIKEVHKDHWDDYQLRSVQIGGNKALFEILKEYAIENEALLDKYKHPCIKWYQKSHVAKMDGAQFDVPKPPKDWNERYELTKTQLTKESVQWGENLKVIGGHISVGTKKASEKVKSLA